MERWKVELRRGKRLLAHHRPAKALKSFRLAKSECGLRNPSAFAGILYYEGIALQKLNMPGRAIRRWVESQRYIKRGFSRRMLSRVTNEYGMARQKTQALDDRAAFFSVHLSRYLRRKESRKIETSAEDDMIRELIDEYWQALVRCNVLEGKDACEKLAVFHDVLIVFPYFDVPEHLDSDTVHVDFGSKRRIAGTDRCPCGTGLPYRKCCGRTPGQDELATGEF